MDAFTLALEVRQSIDPQHVRVPQEVMGLEVEQCAASLGQSPLQADQSRDVLVILSQVVQQGDDLLAEDRSLNRLVPCVQRVLAEAT